MAYGLLYDSPQGLGLVLFEEPNDETFSVAAWDTLKEVQGQFEAAGKRLAEAGPMKKLDLFAMLTFMWPKVIKMDSPEGLEQHLIKKHNFIYFINPLGLPKYSIRAKESVRQLIMFDMLNFLQDKYAKGIDHKTQ